MQWRGLAVPAVPPLRLHDRLRRFYDGGDRGHGRLGEQSRAIPRAPLLLSVQSAAAATATAMPQLPEIALVPHGVLASFRACDVTSNIT